MAAAWRKAFDGAPGVVVVEGDILDGPCDALLSPANSFGFMDGGIDLAYRRYFGSDIQARVQAKIRSEFHGELPVGQAMVVPTGHETVPYLVAAPTMRIPDKIGDTVNVYLAFRAALLAVVSHNKGSTASIKTMRTPALGRALERCLWLGRRIKCMQLTFPFLRILSGSRIQPLSFYITRTSDQRDGRVARQCRPGKKCVPR